MTMPRSLVLSEKESVYHCISRCVRRAFLYGTDLFSGNNYDYRKEWIRDRLIFLVNIFAIETLQYAIMDNHTHTMLRTRPDVLESLSNKDVIYRWLLLYPKKGVSDDMESETAKAYVEELARDEKRVIELRKRLSSVSWFMKSLNEYIARKANKEDDCKGRFWEGRFKCTRIESEAAMLACAVYIDLNPIRAGKAQTPETSVNTSGYERISNMVQMDRAKSSKEPDLWIVPINDTEKRRGFLSITFTEYLTVLDITGRQLREGKKGRIPSELESILTRLDILPDGWLETINSFGHQFPFFAASEQVIRELAKSLGKNWVKGLSASRVTFA